MVTFTLQFTPVNKVALTLGEIEKLKTVRFKVRSSSRCQRCFLIQCYTGLSYADIKHLGWDNIHQDDSGNHWIKMTRQKTQIAFSVPLLEPALDVIEKYKLSDDLPQHLLPVLSNQKMNLNLKLIQELAGISKNLTTHLARHTFATTITLSNGVPIETVSRMLGHTKLSTTQVYAKVLDNKIAEDMQLLKNKMKNRKKDL